MIKTDILKLSDQNQSKEILQQVARLLKKGGVIAFPTETIYALGVDAMNREAVKRVFFLKKREVDKPIAIFLKDANELGRFVKTITPSARNLMKKFWPGPLTLIFKSKPGKLTYLTSQEGKLGVRVSSSKLVSLLLSQIKTPLTATSANLSGKKEPVSPDEVLKDFEGKIELVLDGGRVQNSTPSSIVDVSGDMPILLREGRISFDELKKVAPELERKRS